MARDSKDKSTLPLIPEPKKAGRPSTGSAMSAAERKASQRLRDRLKSVVDGLSDWSNTALCDRLQKAVSAGHVEVVKEITLELMKRARLAMKDNVTVTKTKAASVTKTKPVTVTKTKPTAVAKSKPVTVTKTKSTSAAKSKPVTVTKKQPISTGAAMAKREAELKKMISQAKPKQPSLI